MRRLRFPRLLRCVRRLISRITYGSGGRSHAWKNTKVVEVVRPQLPAEVWEAILGFLRDDRRAIAACALTCRAFIPMIRDIVFHTLRLSHSLTYSNYLSFVALLRDSPHVALSVRELSITIEPEEGQPCLPPILPRLHEVERLTLNFSGGMFDMSEDTRDRLSTYFHSVKKLRLENVRFDGTDLLQLLCACPELKALHMSAVYWRRSSLLPAFTPDLAAIVPSAPVELDELILQTPPAQVVAWLVRGPFALRPRRMDLHWDGSTDGKYVPKLFESAGKSLLDLTLEFPGWFSFREAMNLSHNTNLTWLRFDKVRVDGSQPRFVYIPDPVQLHSHDWIPAALSRLQSPRIQQVHFNIELCNSGELSVLDWDLIDTHLVRLARGSDGKLVASFHVLNSDYKPAKYNVTDAIMYRLPRLRAAMCRVGVVYTHWPNVEECWFP